MNESCPNVSVIIPVYNAEKYLRKSLDSVCGQSLKEIEILCVDDGSADASPQILAEYAARDPRIRVFSQENARQGAARNLALGKIRGDYVAFLDADDMIVPEALKTLYTTADAGKLDMLMFSVVRTDEKDRDHAFGYHDFSRFLPSSFPRKCFSVRDCTSELFWRMPCSCWGTFYARAFIEKHAFRFPEKIFFEDRPFFFKALALAERVGVLTEELYRYRITPNSTMETQTRHLADYIAQGRLTLRGVRECGVSEAILDAGVVEYAHGLLKLIAICPIETLRENRREIVAVFEELFPAKKRVALLGSMRKIDCACSRMILGEASEQDRSVIRAVTRKYGFWRCVVWGKRRRRYREKSTLARKFSVFAHES